MLLTPILAQNFGSPLAQTVLILLCLSEDALPLKSCHLFFQVHKMSDVGSWGNPFPTLGSQFPIVSMARPRAQLGMHLAASNRRPD